MLANGASVYSLSPRMKDAVREFFEPFWEQFQYVEQTLIELAKTRPIALCALYGSMLKGVRAESDIDILVLVQDQYKASWDFLDLCDDIRDTVEDNLYNSIPVDVHIRSVSSFTDTTHGTEFKRSFCEHNIIFWEDGVSVDRRFIEKA